MNKILVAILYLVLLVPILPASAQIADRLVVGEKIYRIHSNPLESFFNENPELRPRGGSSAMERGYLATFELIENQLYVIDIQVQEYDVETRSFYLDSVMHEVFPDEDRVLLSWYSGILIAPQGQEVQYVHWRYDTLYEEYSLFQIINGSLREERFYPLLEYEDFRARQFRNFQHTEEFKIALRQFVNDGMYPTNIKRYIYYYMEDSISDFFVD